MRENPKRWMETLDKARKDPSATGRRRSGFGAPTRSSIPGLAQRPTTATPLPSSRGCVHPETSASSLGVPGSTSALPEAQQEVHDVIGVLIYEIYNISLYAIMVVDKRFINAQ